jgi:hypothetical protein
VNCAGLDNRMMFPFDVKRESVGMRFTSKGRSFGEGERCTAIASGCPGG